MDAPKCKICGDRHWDLCADLRVVEDATIIPTDEIPDELPSVLTGEAATNDPEPASNISDASNTASNRKQRWDREKYNEYQREYMRRKRAKV